MIKKPQYQYLTLMVERTSRFFSNNKESGAWEKIFLLLVFGLVFLWITITSMRIWAMENKLDHYIVDHRFIGSALVIFGVPNTDSISWNYEHSGWDFFIPSNTQVLFTPIDIENKSRSSITLMKKPDGSLQQLAIQTSDDQYPYFSGLGSLGFFRIDLDNDQYVKFWWSSEYIQCDPCSHDQEYPILDTREAVEKAAIAELTRRIQAGEIPLSSLEILEYQQ